MKVRKVPLQGSSPRGFPPVLRVPKGTQVRGVSDYRTEQGSTHYTVPNHEGNSVEIPNLWGKR